MNSVLSDSDFIFDADCDDDHVYLMGKKQGYGFAHIAWGDIGQQKVAQQSKWSVWGYAIQTLDPSEPLETPIWSVESGFNNLLENAMTGCEVAQKALRDLVKTNPDYEDYAPTVEALSA